MYYNLISTRFDAKEILICARSCYMFKSLIKKKFMYPSIAKIDVIPFTLIRLGHQPTTS